MFLETWIEDSQIKALERIKTRLYSENRMTGDEMRDMAQTLDAIIEQIKRYAQPT
jgi:hypothetical protein